jgi:hypothetical protein
MKTNNNANLTDNAWVERTQELKQIVSDAYNPYPDGVDRTLCTPDEFVEWLMSDDVDTEFDSDDEASLLNWAKRKLNDVNEDMKK